MNKYLLGKKLGMTQLIAEDGTVLPVTIVEAGPCTVLELPSDEDQQSENVTLGYGALKEKKQTKSIKGYFNKVGVEPKAVIKSVKLNADGLEAKQELTVEIFELNEKVNVRSKSIGRGFTGTIKRHNFRRGPMSHGSKSHRIPGSIGAGTFPARVFKGTKMAGQHGNQNVTVKNLEVVMVDLENKHLYIKGAIPGKKNNLVEIFN